MAVGEHIVSAFNGPADLHSFDLLSVDLKSFDLKNHKVTSTTLKPAENTRHKILENYYQQVRDAREGKHTNLSLHKIFDVISNDYLEDWLLSVELYELATLNSDADFANDIAAHLENVKQNNPEREHLIDDGLRLSRNA